MKIEKGKKYLCTKTALMNGTNKLVYEIGKIYESEIDGAITNEDGNIHHYLSESFCPEKYFKEVFVPQWGEEVEMSNSQFIWYKVIFIGNDPFNKGGYVGALNDNGITFYRYLYCRPLKYKELTKQEIADKFEIPLDKLKIVD